MIKRDFLISFVSIIITVLLVIYFWENSILLFVLLILLSVFEITNWHNRKDLVLYFISFIAGPILEAVVIKIGSPWSYSSPDFFNIPLWLFPLWGLTGLNLNRFVISLSKKLK